MERCPTQAVLPLVGLAAENVIRDRYSNGGIASCADRFGVLHMASGRWNGSCEDAMAPPAGRELGWRRGKRKPGNQPRNLLPTCRCAPQMGPGPCLPDASPVKKCVEGRVNLLLNDAKLVADTLNYRHECRERCRRYDSAVGLRNELRLSVRSVLPDFLECYP
ncbi:MAG: hypothetical protein ACQESR_01175 [Planctomycetota bacterium]